MRSMLLRNNQIRAIDRFFDNAWTSGMSAFAAMDKVFDSITQDIPPEDGSEFTGNKMVPVKYKVEHKKDGSVHYNIINDEPSAPEFAAS